MSSLRQLLATHAPLLVIDAASARVQVGWLAPEREPSWIALDEEAGTGVFRGVAALDVRPGDAGAFVFCDGPGSVLGIRTAAMALRAWHTLTPRPMFAYHSLALVAEALRRPDVHIISDARRDSWHCLALGGPLRRVPTADLVGELAMPEGFRHWTPLPRDVAQVPYSVSDLLSRIPEADVFRATEAPDAFLHEEPSYATWTPQVHRAPAS
jgi:tRNA threonylcarbamoyladenosine biosynthesis protein TsaB